MTDEGLTLGGWAQPASVSTPAARGMEEPGMRLPHDPALRHGGGSTL
ncbi:hypothetical protein HMPREF1162_1101 [ [[Propionibacterium] namnetense SK182B-JCVI]|uniref:Uncharacterized protein n=1 Tax=[Propionibacterium] namnetense SK182B-JCVI TaxID=1051006 RepID=F9NWV2_9ACTN|nr:hypothetical protein HMPREF1162_1101 [ [[Propionibacterium] namnetense SK182B-JCVI]